MGGIMTSEYDILEAPLKLKEEQTKRIDDAIANEKSVLSDILPMETTQAMPVRKALVQTIEGKNVMLAITSSATPVLAQVAFSCMIQPRSGDVVLFTADETGSYYILSIIERPGSNQTTTLTFPEDLVVKTEGTVSMIAEKSINLIANQQLNCMAKEALYQSEKVVVQVNHITAKGGTFTAYFKKLSIISDFIYAFSERFMRKTKSYIRQTEQDDQVSAKQISRHASGMYSVKSDITMMKSDKDTFIDGDHVFTAL